MLPVAVPIAFSLRRGADAARREARQPSGDATMASPALAYLACYRRPALIDF